jgi:hypothetical protein
MNPGQMSCQLGSFDKIIFAVSDEEEERHKTL